MKIAPFATEHFFARYEFSTPYQLCNSDCESMTVAELLSLAGITWGDFGNMSLGYTESQGNPELRAMIAAGYAGVAPEDVLNASPRLKSTRTSGASMDVALSNVRNALY